MSAPATQQSDELRIANDGNVYTWQQFLRHYGQAAALRHWHAACLSFLPVAHDGGAAAEQGGNEDGVATEHAAPDDDDPLAWGMYDFLCIFGSHYVGCAMTLNEVKNCRR